MSYKLAPASFDLSHISQEYFYMYPQISIIVKKNSHKSHEFQHGLTENLFFFQKMDGKDNFFSWFFF